MAENVIGNSSREYSFVETKRHRPCLIFRGYRYVQDKIQNQTIYWRCEDRTNCHGRAHQSIGNGSLPILTIKHNHPAMLDEIATINSMPCDGLYHQRRQFQKNMHDHQLRSQDDLSLSSPLPTMTSPIKLENHHNRQQYAQHHPHNHGSVGKNLHLSEVITTAAAMNASHHNGVGLHRSGVVDPIEMNKLLSNITTSMSLPSKTIPPSPNMDYSSRLNHFSWEEIENRFLPVIFRNENGCLQRYTSKMFVENTLFQSESWQRHATLARSLPPLISFPYTDNELKLFRLIVEWHLASFHFKTIPPSDCLIRYDDLLEFYGALRKLRDNVAGDRFNRSLALPPPIPPPMPILPPKQRVSTNPNGLGQSFELPTMVGGVPIKTHLHQRPQHPPAKLYHPSALHSTHPPNYLLRPNSDLIIPFSGACTAHPFNYNPIPSSKSNIPSSKPSSNQWNEITMKSNDKMRSNVPKPMLPMNSISQTETNVRDKISAPSKIPRTAIDVHPMPRDTKESGWVQINNVFVPYVVKFRTRDNDLEKSPMRPSSTNLQREFFVPYEILIKCHIFSDQEFAFKKFLIKANQQDFDIFNSLITNINIFDEKAPEKTLLVNLYHVMIGLQKILYVKLLTTKQPRTQVNKYHADVLAHKGGTLLMSGNKLVPYILQNNRYYVPLMYTYQSVPNVLSQAKRGARAPRQYEIDYLNLLLLYFSMESPPLTSDTLLVDAYSIKCSNYQAPVHFRTLIEHQQYERNRLMNNLVRASQTNIKSSGKTSGSTTKSTVVGPMATKLSKYPPATVVVNPMIHHPSFYGLSPTSTPMKSSLSSSPPSSSMHANSVIVNPLLKSVPDTSENRPQITSPYPSIKSIKHDQHNLNVIVKAANVSSNDWKISIRHIFNEFAFEIDYQKFVQWCQTNLLLPLTSIDDEEKQIAQFNKDDDFYIYHRHLERCISLLKDLKRGTISMTLLPPSTNEVQSSTLVKSPLAGAKKRKTTIPTTRHAPSMCGPASDIFLTSDPNDSDPVLAEIDVRSPELITGDPNTPTLLIDTSDSMDMNDENQDESTASVEKIEDEPTSKSCDVDSSFLIVESNEGDDGKILLDDTLPSCSSGYESAPALNTVDTSAPNPLSSDEENEDDETRSREYSSSCQSEQSMVPILSSVPSNIQVNGTDGDDEETERLSEKKLTTMISSSNSSVTNTYRTRQRDKHGKFRARSRSPTPRSIKKKRSTDEQFISANTITSDQIEQHLRTLSMPSSEQRRTRTRPIKTPTRLVEEISATYSSKVSDPDTNVFESMSSSSSTSTKHHSDLTSTNKNINQDPSIDSHQSCTYNVTISNKPNKLGLTIKKILPR